MIAHLKRLMDAEGLPFNAGRHITFNTRLAQELAKWGDGEGESERLNMALYQAYFVDGLNLAEVEILMGVAEGLGLPLDEVEVVLIQRTMSPAIDADWRFARNLGVTSVPTFAVGTAGVVGAQPYEVLVRLMEHVGAAER